MCIARTPSADVKIILKKSVFILSKVPVKVKDDEYYSDYYKAYLEE